MFEPHTPARHHAPQPIDADTYLIRQMFGEGTAPVAVYVNSMVITGPDPIVVDTGTAVNRDQWFDDVFSLVEPEDIAYVFLSHDDHDHSGNLLPLLEAAPQATLLTTWFTVERLAGDLSIPLERMRWLNDGDTFEAGGRTLALVRPPLYDSPVTRGLFDPASGVYWAVDAYGTTVPHAVDDVADLDPDFWDEQFLGLNRMNSPWASLADPALFGREVDRVHRLDVTTIASAHSPLITGANVAAAQAKMRRIAGGPATPLPTQVDLDALVAAALEPELVTRGGVIVKIGLGLPHLGHFADPDTARTVAVAAEEAGLSSLWAMDRLLAPVAPRTFGYPGRSDGVLPQVQQRVLDPIVTLTLAGAVTETIRLGTDVLVAPWYPPVLLARSLAALDQVSHGRLTVGLGLGWSVDEFDAAGAPMTHRGRRLEEVLDVLNAMWAPGIAAVDTTHEHVAASIVGTKPVQTPGPPVLLAAFNPAGLERIARRADGWLPFGLPLSEIEAGWAAIRQHADRLDRNPDDLQLVVRADPTFTDLPLGSERLAFTGTRAQVADDIDRVEALGADELILDLQTSTCTADELIDTALALASTSLALAA